MSALQMLVESNPPATNSKSTTMMVNYHHQGHLLDSPKTSPVAMVVNTMNKNDQNEDEDDVPLDFSSKSSANNNDDNEQRNRSMKKIYRSDEDDSSSDEQSKSNHRSMVDVKSQNNHRSTVAKLPKNLSFQNISHLSYLKKTSADHHCFTTPSPSPPESNVSVCTPPPPPPPLSSLIGKPGDVFLSSLVKQEEQVSPANLQHQLHLHGSSSSYAEQKSFFLNKFLLDDQWHQQQQQQKQTPPPLPLPPPPQQQDFNANLLLAQYQGSNSIHSSNSHFLEQALQLAKLSQADSAQNLTAAELVQAAALMQAAAAAAAGVGSNNHLDLFQQTPLNASTVPKPQKMVSSNTMRQISSPEKSAMAQAGASLPSYFNHLLSRAQSMAPTTPPDNHLSPNSYQSSALVGTTPPINSNVNSLRISTIQPDSIISNLPESNSNKNTNRSSSNNSQTTSKKYTRPFKAFCNSNKEHCNSKLLDAGVGGMKNIAPTAGSTTTNLPFPMDSMLMFNPQSIDYQQFRKRMLLKKKTTTTTTTSTTSNSIKLDNPNRSSSRMTSTPNSSQNNGCGGGGWMKSDSEDNNSNESSSSFMVNSNELSNSFTMMGAPSDGSPIDHSPSSSSGNVAISQMMNSLKGSNSPVPSTVTASNKIQASPTLAVPSTTTTTTNNFHNNSQRKRGRPLPDDLKDEAYWERRRKNNEAAKRSRDLRRAKEDEIAIQAAYLQEENTKLKYELIQIRIEYDKLKAMWLATPQGQQQEQTTTSSSSPSLPLAKNQMATKLPIESSAICY